MDICRTYPKFDADQVLTAEQLNSLFSFLDLQNRWTRKCFIGAGIACGFQIEVNETDRSVIISEGCGLTTLGYLIKQPLTRCSHYTQYTDPTQYSYFKKDDEQVPLWQLLPDDSFDSEDPDNKRIELSFLANKVLVLFLEVNDIDLDTCTGSDCDEKGTEVNLCVRILLIEKNRLDQLLQRQADNKLTKLYAQNIEKYALPRLGIGRINWLGDEHNLFDLADIQSAYKELISDKKIAEFREAMSSAYDVYYPILNDNYRKNPFSDWKPVLDQSLGIQYLYDHFKDISLAYHEFVDDAFNVFVNCCVPEETFPKHLMVGCLYEAKKCRPSRYRHLFVTAMEPTHGEQQLRRISALFKRLVILTRAFRVPVLKSGAIKITPSKEKGTALGLRSIPHYYDIAKFPQLKNVWNFDIADRCLSKNLISYELNKCRPDCSDDSASKFSGFSRKFAKTPARFPLNANLDDYPFYRIEGHLGKDYSEASNEINNWLKCYNLPVKLVGLKVGSVDKDILLSLGCKFEDIDLIYLSQGEKIVCYFKQTLELIQSVKFDAPQDDLEASTSSKVVGIFIDGKTKKPLANVYYTIRKLDLVNQTDRSGKLEFSGITPGTYLMDTYLKGYGSKSFQVSVKHEQTLKLGEIALYQDALLLDTELFYKNKTSEEEDRRRAEHYKLADKNSKENEKSDDGQRPIRYSYGAASRNLEIYSKPPDSRSESKAGEYPEKGYAEEIAEVSPYAIGSIYAEIKASQSKDIYASAKQYIYERFANNRVEETDHILDKIYQPLQIVATLNKLIAELEKPLLQFDRSYFTGLYEQLLSQVEKYKDIITGGKYEELFEESDRQDLIRYFNLLKQERCFNQFQSLMDAYAARKLKLDFFHLLSVYSDKNRGMSHVAGCWAGGTFILVYDDSHRVVLDFALPYICCSDCPPIQYCNDYPVVFKLPKEHFCKNDDREFRFITNFPGGEVIGQGVISHETTGDFFFKPSATDVTAGQIEFSYFLNEARYDYSVTLEDPKVSIIYRLINIDSTAKTAEVQFTTSPQAALEYLWDFGDDSSSTKASPVKVYDLSTVNSYTVKLKAKQGQCYANATHDLTFEVCNASFTYLEVERSLTTISYQFSHPQTAKTRLWEMGDGNSFEDFETFEHVYELGDVERNISVSLTMSQDTCSDSKTETLNIPARTRVTIFMDKNSLCRNGLPEKVVFDPKNGSYQGNGLIVKDGQVYFHPGHPSVVIGNNEISYEYQGQRVTREVSVSTIEETFSSEILLIDADEKIARVQFTAPDNMDSYAFDLGDGQTSAQSSFTHSYDISSSAIFTVNLNLVNGACVATQIQELDLTPCSAEFSFKVLRNDGANIVIEYTMHEPEGKEYQLTDELGTVKSAARVIQRTYRLSATERNIDVTMRLLKPPCESSFSTLVPLPKSVPLSLSMETTQFVWCDENRYPVNVNSDETHGVASGPGVLTEGDDIFFIPALANTGGDVTINYQLDQQRTSLTVNLKRPMANFEIKSVSQTINNISTVSVINNSSDFNHAVWLFNPGGKFETDQSTFRIADVEPGQPVTVSLSVDWDEMCPNTSPRKTFHIPQVEPEIDLRNYITSVNRLKTSDGFGRVFPSGSTVTDDTTEVISKIQESLASPEIAAAYRMGNKNKDISTDFDPLIAATQKQILTVARNNSPEIAQAGYPLLVFQLSVILELVSFTRGDVGTSDSLSKTLKNVNTGLAGLMEHGVRIDFRKVLSKPLDLALERNAGKPNTIKALKKMRELAG